MLAVYNVVTPVTCERCGRSLELPERNVALLDEYGFAHVVCECGSASRIPFESVEDGPSERRRRGPWRAIALWLVILGLLILLLPAIRVEKIEDPSPPEYLTV